MTTWAWTASSSTRACTTCSRRVAWRVWGVGEGRVGVPAGPCVAEARVGSSTAHVQRPFSTWQSPPRQLLEGEGFAVFDDNPDAGRADKDPETGEFGNAQDEVSVI